MRIFFAAAIITCCYSAASAETILGSTFGFGNWSGEAYTSDSTGSFSHCAISASYLSGDILYFTVNSDASVSIAVQSPGLNLVEGSRFPVSLFVDRRRPFYGSAEALKKDFATLRIYEFDRAMAAFQRGYVLKIESPAGSVNYNLTGTFRALEAARNCAIRHLNYTSVSPNTATSVSSFDRTLLFQIATGMISELGVEDFKYLSTSETRKFFNDAVFWTSDEEGVLGGVLVIPRKGAVNIRDADGSDIAYLTNDCDGEVATMLKDVSLDDNVGRQIRAICINEGQQIDSILNKIFIGNQVLYTLLVFTSDYEITQGESTQSISERITLRAASFVRDIQ